MRKFEIGDKIDVRDGSWSFGVANGKYANHVAYEYRKGLTVIQSELCVQRKSICHSSENCDLLVTDGDGNYFFVPSDLCELVDKKNRGKVFLRWRRCYR